MALQTKSTGQYSTTGLDLHHDGPAAGQRDISVQLQHNGATAGGAAEFYFRHIKNFSPYSFRNFISYSPATEVLDLTGAQVRVNGVAIGGSNAVGASNVTLLPPHATASDVATNLALSTVNAVNDPNYRLMMDARGKTIFRIMGRMGGTLVSATQIRIQYHLGGDPTVGTGDAGWATLGDSGGSRTANIMFYTSDIAIPGAALVNHLLIRAVLFSGDGAADPTITACALNLY
jgi:hypothetical protein